MSTTTASTCKTGPVGVGFIGVGNISDAYLANLTKFPDVEVLFLSDLDTDRAKAQAEKWGVPKSGTVDQLLADPDVELVVNLTIPAAHAEIDLLIIGAGKHVWSEKPYAVTRESARAVREAAETAGVLACAAPDTILGAGIQTGLRAIKSGAIGRPLSAVTLFQVDGPESWHPSPEFLYAHGGGPLMDMGPYYLSTLVCIFGSASRVSAIGSRSTDTRIIATGPKAGKEFPVEEPTHVTAIIEFAAGGSAQCVFSFESHKVRMGFVEVNGSTASIDLPDPNNFDGDSVVNLAASAPTIIPAVGNSYGRGTGVLEMAQAIRGNRLCRIPGDLPFHVLDIMLSIREAATSGQWVKVVSSAPAMEPMPLEWDPMVATLV